MKKKVTARKSKKKAVKKEKIFKPWIYHTFAVVLFFLVNVIYFYPQLQGKVIPQGDITNWKASAKEINDYREANGEELLWTNSMFSGMPSFVISVRHDSNLLKKVHKVLQMGIKLPIGLFFLMMISMYFALVLLKVDPRLAIMGAVAFALATNYLDLLQAGHNSKLYTLAYLPVVGTGALLAFQKRYLLGGLIFALGLGLNMIGRHFQMSYYFALCLVILGVIYFIKYIQEKDAVTFLKASGALLFAGALGLLPSTSSLLTTNQYAKDTMRGDPILAVTAAEPQSSSETEGLEWNYATRWSASRQDLLTTFIPGAAGGANAELVDQNSAFGSAMRRAGAPATANGKYRAPLYWGGPDSVGAPAYLGAGLWFFFVLGLFLVKGEIKWWFGASVLFLMMLSLGRNLEWFTRIFFDHVPMFNKFRTPNSILSVLVLFIPFFATYSAHQLFNKDLKWSDVKKPFLYALGITGGLSAVLLLLGPSLFSFSVPALDAPYAQNGSLDLIIQDRKSLLQRDAGRSLIFILLAAGLAWAFFQRNLNKNLLFGGLILLTLIDIGGIGRRYVTAENFVNRTNLERIYAERPADQQIKARERSRGDYRVFDLSVNTFNSAIPSYHHNTIGGYSAAKLQRYNDLIIRHIAQGNQQVLNMLNAKYIISRDGQLQTNGGALGHAWFVNNIRTVNSPDEEIDALSAFNPSSEAIFLEKEFQGKVAKRHLSKAGTITLEKYDPQHMVYKSNAPSDQFAVFSEIWSNRRGEWKTLIDGNETDHVRVNFALRGMSIPQGEHTIEFLYQPQSFTLGSTISLIFSLILVLALVAILVLFYLRRNNKDLMPGLFKQLELE